MSEKVKKYLLNFLKFVVSAAAILWVLHNVSFKEVLKVFSTSNGWLLLVAAMFLFSSFVLSGFRQNLSFRSTGAHLSPLLNLKLFWLGLFYNLFLPSGIGGDGIKVYLVNKYRQNGVKKNIGAMLVNRISGLVAVGMITIVLYYISGDEFKIGWIGWLGIPFLYLLYYYVLRFFLKSFLPIHAGLFGWSMILQLMQLLSALFILNAFHQFDNISEYLFLFFFSTIATALPITIGGLGAREVVFLLGAKYLHMDNELSIALSFMTYLISALASLGGIYWVFFPPFRREDRPEKHAKGRFQ
ncbi:MAG: lysylphosphatidylglycerol synthase transmembrane domain-containing protein [Bacteroidia bacterium]|nr:lysylphosphatidylglycerol synthase transmembrane domain-containing protein [Bacteroidia bacterium]